MSDKNSPTIGYIVGRGLQANLQVRLTVPADQLQEGGFVVIESGDWVYCGLVTDLMLGATNPRFADEQSEQRLPESLAQLLHGQTLFTNLVVLPALMMARIPDIGTPEYEPWRKRTRMTVNCNHCRSRRFQPITPRFAERRRRMSAVSLAVRINRLRL